MWRRSLFVFLCFATLAIAEDQNAPKEQEAPKARTPLEEGTYYNYGQVGVTKKEVDGSTINLTFKPIDEQFYWCPGIRVEKVKVGKTKKEVTVVTFVRCKTSEDAGIDKQAKIGTRLIRTVSFDTKGLDVFVREGKKFRRIYEAPVPDPKPTEKKAKNQRKKKSSKKSKKKTNSKVKKKKEESKAFSSLMLYPATDHDAKREVPNYHVQAAE